MMVKIKYFWFDSGNIWVEKKDRVSGDVTDYRLKVGEFEPVRIRCIGFDSKEERDNEYDRVEKIIANKNKPKFIDGKTGKEFEGGLY